MRRSLPPAPLLSALLLALVSWTLPERASAFAVLYPVTTPCPTCPGGAALDLERTLLAGARWNARPGAGGLADGIRVNIDGSIPLMLGISDPVLIEKMEGAIAAGVRAWSSPAVAFDITVGAPGYGEEISILAGTSWALGGHMEWETAFSPNRMFTNGDVVPGVIITGARVMLNFDTLVLLFRSLGESYSLAVLQRLVAHEMGHALGLDHPTDVYEFNIDSDSDPENALVVDFHHPFAGLIQSTAVDPSAIMVPYSDLPALYHAFETPLHLDDLAGRDVLYPYLVPEPSLLALLGVAVLVARRRGA